MQLRTFFLFVGEEQCSLVCLAVNTTVYHQWSDKVIDGTKCHRLSDDQCVDGICQVGNPGVLIQVIRYVIQLNNYSLSGGKSRY